MTTAPAAIHASLTDAIDRRVPVAVATVVRGEPLGAKLLVLPDDTLGSVGDPVLDRRAAEEARALLADETSETRSYETAAGPVDLFLEAFPPPPVLLIFGGVHAAQPLTHFAKRLGFDVIVTDARAKLATAERFPDADRIIVGWPDEVLEQVEVGPNWYVAILSHDPKFDEPALLGTLGSPARYIGAIGSRKTNLDRRRRLEEAGATPEQMARIRGPIGLDIGARTPEEMAISILGEIVALRNGREGGRLTAATGNIRGERETAAARA